MNKIITTLLALLIASPAFAADPIQVINPWGPGGSSAQTVQFLSDGLNDKGYKTESKNLNNCALLKNLWDNATSPIIALRGTDLDSAELKACNITTDANNYVFTNHNTVVYFCNAGPNGKSLEDFNKPGVTHIVADTNTLPAATTEQFSKRNKNTVKLLMYPLISNVAAAAKANEIDYIFANGPWPEAQLGAKCFWVTGNYNVPGYKNGKDLYPDMDIMNLTYSYWFIAKGFTPAEMDKLRKDAVSVWTSKADWLEQRKKRGWADNLVPSTDIEAVKMHVSNKDIQQKYAK